MKARYFDNEYVKILDRQLADALRERRSLRQELRNAQKVLMLAGWTDTATVDAQIARIDKVLSKRKVKAK